MIPASALDSVFLGIPFEETGPPVRPLSVRDLGRSRVGGGTRDPGALQGTALRAVPKAAEEKENPWEERMLVAVGLRRPEDRHRAGTDAVTPGRGERPGPGPRQTRPAEFKSVKRGGSVVSTNRDFGPEHCAKWREHDLLICERSSDAAVAHTYYGIPRRALATWVGDQEQRVAAGAMLCEVFGQTDRVMPRVMQRIMRDYVDMRLAAKYGEAGVRKRRFAIPHLRQILRQTPGTMLSPQMLVELGTLGVPPKGPWTKDDLVRIARWDFDRILLRGTTQNCPPLPMATVRDLAVPAYGGFRLDADNAALREGRCQADLAQAWLRMTEAAERAEVQEVLDLQRAEASAGATPTGSRLRQVSGGG